MLTTTDIDFMNGTRTEITTLRLKPLTLKRTVVGEDDPYTGNPIITYSTDEVLGTWMALTGGGMGGGGDYEFVDGVKVQSGDVVANVSIEYDVEGTTEVIRNGKRYAVRAIEHLGIGEENRHFLLLRRIT